MGVVPGTEVAGVNPLSILPAANIAPFASADTPEEKARLAQFQADLARFTGGNGVVNQPDLIMVNPSGRLVEVSGEMVDEYLGKPGFRRASDNEAEGYKKAILRSTPEYLRRLEKKRLQQQEALLDMLEEEDDDDETSTAELQRAPILNGQSTGAPLEAPKAAVSEQAKAATTTTTTTDETEVKTRTTAKPRSRSSKKK